MVEKIQITVTISKDSLDWIDGEMNDTSRFSSRSHAVEYALKALRTENKPVS